MLSPFLFCLGINWVMKETTLGLKTGIKWIFTETLDETLENMSMNPHVNKEMPTIS